MGSHHRPSPRTSDQRPVLNRRAFIGYAAGGAALSLLGTSGARARPGLTRASGAYGPAGAVGQTGLSGAAGGLSSANPTMLRDYEGRLCYNENPLGPSPLAMDAMTGAVQMSHRYPDWYAESLRDDIVAQYPDLGRNNIIAGTGATEILLLCALAFSSTEGNVVSSYPSYSQFPSDCDFLGSEVRYADLDENFRISLDNMADQIDQNTTAIIVTNANNPTGTVLSHDEIALFVDSLPPEIVVIIDEAYHEFIQDPGYASMADLVAQDKNVVIVRTFSKSHGLAGMRIGYAIARSEQAQAMNAWHQWGTVNHLGLEAARAALGDTDHIQATVDLAGQVKAYCYSMFDAMGLNYIPSETNFFMVEVGNAQQVANQLRDAGYYVRTGWGMPKWIRVSCGLMEEMEGFILALQDILAPQDGGELRMPTRTALHGNYPNPARGGTQIKFDLAHGANVNLEIFDLAGRLVRTLASGRRTPGQYTHMWDGVSNAGYPVRTGSYFYRLTAGDHTEIRRLILLPE